MAKTSKENIQPEIMTLPENTLFDRVGAYLDANDWRYSPDPERGCYSMSCKIKEATVRVVLDVFESEDWLRVMAFSIYPVFAPEHRRPAVLETLNRINHSLSYGSFEMDPADGEIRFRTSVESEFDIPESMIDRVLNVNLFSANKHFGTLMAAAFGGVDPEGAKELASIPEDATLQ